MAKAQALQDWPATSQSALIAAGCVDGLTREET